MKKFAVAVLVLMLALMLTGCGKTKSDRIWEELTKQSSKGEITTTVTEDGSLIQRYTLYESFN